jgi:hypothetical protein
MWGERERKRGRQAGVVRDIKKARKTMESMARFFEQSRSTQSFDRCSAWRKKGPSYPSIGPSYISIIS